MTFPRYCRSFIPFKTPLTLHPPPSVSSNTDQASANGVIWPYVTEYIGQYRDTSDMFSRLLRERIIILNGQVHDTLSASIIAQLLYLESTDPEKEISMYINSPGGSVSAGLAIYDTMRYISSPVSTLCIGQAASMGSLLLAAGAKGRRFVTQNGSVMIHQPSGGFSGQASDIAIHAREILRIRERLNKIYQYHLNGEQIEIDNTVGTYDSKLNGDRPERSLQAIDTLMERDYFMGAEEAVELGIVDQVLTRRPKDV